MEHPRPYSKGSCSDWTANQNSLIQNEAGQREILKIHRDALRDLNRAVVLIINAQRMQY